MTLGELTAWTASHGEILRRTIGEHLTLSAAALAIVLATGLPLGTALSRRPRLAALATGVANTLRTVPSLALLVLMLPLLGTGRLPALVALTLYGLPTVLVSTLSGLARVEADVIEAARGQGLSERQVMFGVSLPLAAPVILAGVRNAAVQIVSAATLAVFVGGGGLGELISAGMALLDIPQLVAGSLLVAALAIATEFGLAGVERLLARRFGTAPA